MSTLPMQVYQLFCIINIINHVSTTPSKGAHLRVVGGRKVSIKVAPYLVQIIDLHCLAEQNKSIEINELEDHDSHSHVICGGVYIQLKWVITSAICIYDWEKHAWKKAKNLLIRAGTSIRQLNRIGQHSNVAKLFHHPNASPAEHLGNNIALIKLQRSFHRNEYVRFIHLPRFQNMKNIAEYFNSQPNACGTMGWGSTTGHFDNVQYSEHLKMVLVKLIPLERYKKYFNKGSITDDLIGAGRPHSKVGGDMGDSGSPLVCKRQLIGLAIMRPYLPNATEIIPMIYARVDMHLHWIKITVRNNRDKGHSTEWPIHHDH